VTSGPQRDSCRVWKLRKPTGNRPYHHRSSQTFSTTKSLLFAVASGTGAPVQLARVFAGIESQEVAMTSVDRLGFHVRLKTEDGTRSARIAFLREVSSAEEARTVLVEMVGQARRM
jgi:hypothetical protein